MIVFISNNRYPTGREDMLHHQLRCRRMSIEQWSAGKRKQTSAWEITFSLADFSDNHLVWESMSIRATNQPRHRRGNFRHHLTGWLHDQCRSTFNHWTPLANVCNHYIGNILMDRVNGKKINPLPTSQWIRRTEENWQFIWLQSGFAHCCSLFRGGIPVRLSVLPLQSYRLSLGSIKCCLKLCNLDY